MPTIAITCSIPKNHPFKDDPSLIDEVLFLLVEKGASGTTQSVPERFEVYVEADDVASAISFVESVIADSSIALQGEAVPEQNWTQTSQELLQPVQAGRLSIRPVIDALEASQLSKDDSCLLIIPGMGFGTGHHPTTKTVIEHLQSNHVAQSLKNFESITAADFGTGSGLLAIAMARLFKNISGSIYAFDNDSAAIANALENAQINHTDSTIQFAVADKLEGRFSLVTANIYAEVLCQCYEQFLRSVLPGGILILSGIMEQKVELIKEKFTTLQWDWLTVEVVNGWATITLKRANKE